MCERKERYNRVGNRVARSKNRTFTMYKGYFLEDYDFRNTDVS